MEHLHVMTIHPPMPQCIPCSVTPGQGEGAAVRKRLHLNQTSKTSTQNCC